MCIRDSHSSAPRADNALYDMADALQAIRALRFPVQFNEVNRAMAQALVASRGGALAQALQTLMAQPDNAAARAVEMCIRDRYNAGSGTRASAHGIRRIGSFRLLERQIKRGGDEGYDCVGCQTGVW